MNKIKFKIFPRYSNLKKLCPLLGDSMAVMAAILIIWRSRRIKF